MQLRGLIFDMDGTLLDTERLALRAWEATEERTGVRFPAEFIYSIVGVNSQTAHNLAAEALGDREQSEAFFDRYREVYHEHLQTDGIPLKPGAREILEWARAAGLRLALATSTRREVADEKLRMTGFDAFFEVTVCGDEIANGKPAPDIFRAAAEKLGVDGDEAIALEDSPNGVRSASAAGLRTILIPDLAPIEAEVERLAWAIEEDLLSAQRRLEGLLARAEAS